MRSSFFKLITFFFCALCSAPTCGNPLNPRESLAIGSAVAKFYRQKVGLSYLIDSKAWRTSQLDNEAAEIVALKKHFGGSVLSGFLADCAADMPVVTKVSNFDSSEFFKNGNYSSKMDWERFHKSHPRKTGFIALAGVGQVDSAAHKLMVYSHSYSSHGCGQAFVLLLKYNSGKWLIDKAGLVAQYEHSVPR